MSGIPGGRAGSPDQPSDTVPGARSHPAGRTGPGRSRACGGQGHRDRSRHRRKPCSAGEAPRRLRRDRAARASEPASPREKDARQVQSSPCAAGSALPARSTVTTRPRCAPRRRLRVQTAAATSAAAPHSPRGSIPRPGLSPPPPPPPLRPGARHPHPPRRARGRPAELPPPPQLLQPGPRRPRTPLVPPPAPLEPSHWPALAGAGPAPAAGVGRSLALGTGPTPVTPSGTQPLARARGGGAGAPWSPAIGPRSRGGGRRAARGRRAGGPGDPSVAGSAGSAGHREGRVLKPLGKKGAEREVRCRRERGDGGVRLRSGLGQTRRAPGTGGERGGGRGLSVPVLPRGHSAERCPGRRGSTRGSDTGTLLPPRVPAHPGPSDKGGPTPPNPGEGLRPRIPPGGHEYGAQGLPGSVRTVPPPSAAAPHSPRGSIPRPGHSPPPSPPPLRPGARHPHPPLPARGRPAELPPPPQLLQPGPRRPRTPLVPPPAPLEPSHWPALAGAGPAPAAGVGQSLALGTGPTPVTPSGTQP
uniref:Basic proline-rich protein-like n=1 Tax=Castor canadensis TaxID=51338 RepID=A0A8B7UIS7_CASCN|nr:basic proline-rich protein-like [Castor canadensis]